MVFLGWSHGGSGMTILVIVPGQNSCPEQKERGDLAGEKGLGEQQEQGLAAAAD